MNEFDVVVVGAGNAALCAAISAREAGATCEDAQRRLWDVSMGK